MAPRTVYANLVDGYQPANLLDFSFQDVGSLGVIPCTASGTNAITITPIASLFPPNINNPPNKLQMFSFTATATSTGLVTAKIDSATGFFNVYRPDGVTQAGLLDFVINVPYLVFFNPALNGNAGGFQIIGPLSLVGYGVGSGGAVTQLTSRTTGVTLNTPSGAITLVGAAGTASFQTFTVTNSVVGTNDIVNILQKSGTDKYQVFVTAVSAGSFAVTFATTGGTTTEQPVFTFNVVKGSIT